MAEPAKVERASTWSDVVEEGKKIFLSMVIWCPLELNNTLSLAYRFQLAGYKNEREYLAVTKLDTVSSKHCLDVLPSHLLTLSLPSSPHILTILTSSHSHYPHLLTLSLLSPPHTLTTLTSLHSHYVHLLNPHLVTRWTGGRIITMSRSCVAGTVASTTMTGRESAQRKTCRRSSSTSTDHHPQTVE